MNGERIKRKETALCPLDIEKKKLFNCLFTVDFKAILPPFLAAYMLVD